MTGGARRALGLGALATLGMMLAACEYPAFSKVEPNPVAYVRPAPVPPFADGGAGRGSGGLSPYVAVTIPPPGPQGPPGSQSAATGTALGAAAPPPEGGSLFSPRPPPVVTVPAYTAPVYSPSGVR
ncbi:MAG: hypothetical protein WCO00_12210 [Rhodospirillaceae bacterium]